MEKKSGKGRMVVMEARDGGWKDGLDGVNDRVREIDAEVELKQQ
jgi:hypothetical protein